MKKSIFCVCIILSSIFVLCSCSNSNSTSTQVSTNLSEIGNQIIENVTMQPMYELAYEDFANSYLTEDFDDSIIEEYSLYEADNPLYVDTIILLKLKSENSMDSVKSILESIQQEKISANANGYNPQQYEIATNGLITQNGNLIYLVISEQKEEIISIINSYIK